MVDWFYNHISITLPETNSSHLRMEGLEDQMSFWDGLFSGAAILNFMEGISLCRLYWLPPRNLA